MSGERATSMTALTRERVERVQRSPLNATDTVDALCRLALAVIDAEESGALGWIEANLREYEAAMEWFHDFEIAAGARRARASVHAIRAALKG